MHHAPKSVTRQVRQRETSEAVPEQNRNFGGNNCDGNIDKQNERGQTRQQTDDNERTAEDFTCASEWCHDFWMGKPDFSEAPRPKFRRIKKLLNTFGKKDSADEQTNQNCRRRCIG